MSKLRTLHLVTPVNGKVDLSITPDRFASLTLAEQEQLQNRMGAEFPYHGSADADEDFVRPECRKGVDLNDLEDIMNSSRGRVKESCAQVVRDQKRFNKSYHEIYE